VTLTRQDADVLAKDGFGVLVEKLPFNDAVAIQQELQARGVATYVVDQAELPKLPAAKVTRRIDCLDEHLVVHDALGRPRPLPWAKVRVVAAGFVMFTEFRRVRQQYTIAVPGVGGLGSFRPVVMTDFSDKEFQNARLLLELLVEADPPRYQAEARALQYTYLGARQAGTAAQNFVTLVRDLLGLAPGASLNRGAAAVAADPPRTFSYPTRHAFEEETVWLLWNLKRAAFGER